MLHVQQQRVQLCSNVTELRSTLQNYVNTGTPLQSLMELQCDLALWSRLSLLTAYDRKWQTSQYVLTEVYRCSKLPSTLNGSRNKRKLPHSGVRLTELAELPPALLSAYDRSGGAITMLCSLQMVRSIDKTTLTLTELNNAPLLRKYINGN